MVKLSFLNNQDNTSTIIDKIPKYLDIIRRANNAVSISDIPYRDLFSKVIVVNRDKIIFVIGNIDKDKININEPTLFNGTIEHKERATTFTTEFGIVIHA